MSVTTPIASAGPYIADGIVTRFAFEFPIVDTKHVAIYVNGERVVEDVTVTDGEVIFAAAPAAGDRIVILRDIPFTQEMDLQNNTAFLPEVLEQAFDKLIMICQQLQESDARSVKWLPGMDSQPLPEQLLTEAVDAAMDAKQVVKEFNEDFIRKSGEIDRLASEAAAALEKAKAVLASAGILAEDTTLTFAAGGGSEEDSHEAWVANQATLDALPRNLGGHTLHVDLNYQNLPSEDYGGSPNLFFSFDGFYNGHIEISGEIEAYGGASDDRYNEFIRVVNCHCPVLFDRVDFPNAGVHVAVTAKNSTGLTFSNCTFRGYYDPEDVESWPNAGAAVVLTNSDADFTGENTLTDSGSTLLRIADGRDGYFAAAALEQRVAALEAIHTN